MGQGLHEFARLGGGLSEAIRDVVESVDLDGEDCVVEVNSFACFSNSLPYVAVRLGEGDCCQNGENSVVVRADGRRWHESEVGALKGRGSAAQPCRVASGLEEGKVDAIVVAFGRVVCGRDESLEFGVVDARVNAGGEFAAC